MNYPLEVYKFGGASVSNAATIRQVASIIGEKKSGLVVVVSAMGKSTNALETIAADQFKGKTGDEGLRQLAAFHQQIINELFAPSHPVSIEVNSLFNSIPLIPKTDHFDQYYDQVVSLGELVSTIILHAYLKKEGLPVSWVDARDYIHTDNHYREARVDWPATEKEIKQLSSVLQDHIVITQGFIGRYANQFTTTLGRDGSDYSAAIFASCLDAASVTIWKDVPGVMNADPKRLPDATVFEELPFREAAEMTYYGASVIHPKTIKPLANRHIPLWVKSFDNPSLPGTIIHETKVDHIPPLIVFKDNQCLVSCRVMDYTFINEQQLSSIFQALSDLDIRINVMQNSAISFSICVDYREDKVMKLINRLAESFEVYYNTGLTLITIKNYDARTAQQYRSRPGVILEQSSRSTLQILLKG